MCKVFINCWDVLCLVELKIHKHFMGFKSLNVKCNSRWSLECIMHTQKLEHMECIGYFIDPYGYKTCYD